MSIILLALALLIALGIGAGLMLLGILGFFSGDDVDGGEEG